MNLLFKAHTCACSTGKALSGSWIARWMDKVLSAGATKRANELLAARAAHKAALDEYRQAMNRRDTRAQGVIWPRLQATNQALLKAEGMGARR